VAQAAEWIAFEPCRLKAGLKTIFHYFKAPHRDTSDYRSSRVVCSVTLIASGSAFIRGDSVTAWASGVFSFSSALRFCLSNASSARNRRSRIFLKKNAGNQVGDAACAQRQGDDQES
jgi:hypothetical protein